VVRVRRLEDVDVRPQAVLGGARADDVADRAEVTALVADYLCPFQKLRPRCSGCG
jgi:hypothetical protein